MSTHSSQSSIQPPNPRAWRILGATIIGGITLTLLGAALDRGAPLLGAGQHEVVSQFVDMSLPNKVVGSYIEFLSSLASVAAALLLAHLLSGSSLASRWLSSAIMLTAVLEATMVSTALAVQVAAAYDGHHGASWQLLGVINDGADIAYLGSLAVGGLFLVCVASAGLATGRLPVWLCWVGVVVGVASVGSPLGAQVELQQFAFMGQAAWLLALAVTSLARRSPSRATVSSADVLTA